MFSANKHSTNDHVKWIVINDNPSLLSYFNEWKNSWEKAFKRKLSEQVLSQFFLAPR